MWAALGDLKLRELKLSTGPVRLTGMSCIPHQCMAYRDSIGSIKPWRPFLVHWAAAHALGGHACTFRCSIVRLCAGLHTNWQRSKRMQIISKRHRVALCIMQVRCKHLCTTVAVLKTPR